MVPEESSVPRRGEVQRAARCSGGATTVDAYAKAADKSSSPTRTVPPDPYDATVTLMRAPHEYGARPAWWIGRPPAELR